MSIRFDFDPVKSQKNKEKHGIDFIESQSVWLDPDGIKNVPDTVRLGEEYWLALGKVNHRIWVMIYNWRDEKIHIVSIRPSRDYEKEQYEILNKI